MQDNTRNWECRSKNKSHFHSWRILHSVFIEHPLHCVKGLDMDTWVRFALCCVMGTNRVLEPWRRKWQPTPVFLPGKIPWTVESEKLQSMESHSHSWLNWTATTKSARDIWIKEALQGTTGWFKIGKGVCQGCVYCYPAYLTYMQSTSWETLGWMKHKLESRMPGEISTTSYMQITLFSWQKEKRN